MRLDERYAMRVILVSLRSVQGGAELDLGVAVISGALREAGIDYDLIDAVGAENALDRIGRLGTPGEPGVVLLGGMLGAGNYAILKTFCRAVRASHPGYRIFMGGALPSFCPDIVQRHFDLDGIVIGQGQETAADLVRALSEGEPLSDIPGLAFRQEDDVWVETPPRVYVRSTHLPIPDFSRFDMDGYIAEHHRSGRAWNLVGSKGCYSRCVYCTRSDKKVSFRSIEAIVEEILTLYEAYGIDRFNFVDDNFLLDARHITAVADAFAALPFRPRFRFQGRLDRLRDEGLAIMTEAGLSGISFGLESGSPRILEEMKKGITVEQMEEGLRLCRERGVPHHGTLILGMPSENEETVEETKMFLDRNGFAGNYRVCFLTLFPGTPLYADALAKNLIPDEDAYCASLNSIYDEIRINMTGYSDDALWRWRRHLETAKP